MLLTYLLTYSSQVLAMIDSCTHHTIVFGFALRYSEAVHSRIWYPSQLESTCLVYGSRPRYSDALHPLLWLHPQIASTAEYQALGSRHRYLGPSGTLEEWGFGLAPLVKKISHGHKNIGAHGLAHFFAKTLVVRYEVAPPRCHPIFKSNICHCRARCIIIGSGFIHKLCHTSIITPSNQASISSFSIILYSILLNEILHFQLVVRKQRHKSTAGP